MNALARIRLCSRNAPFVAHLAGFDGTDMFFGLVIAHEIGVRLGHIHLSGLEAARQVWGVTLESVCERNPPSLWQGLAAHVIALAASPYSMWDLRVAKRRVIYARLLTNLVKEPHRNHGGNSETKTAN